MLLGHINNQESRQLLRRQLNNRASLIRMAAIKGIEISRDLQSLEKNSPTFSG